MNFPTSNFKKTQTILIPQPAMGGFWGFSFLFFFFKIWGYFQRGGAAENGGRLYLFPNPRILGRH